MIEELLPPAIAGADLHGDDEQEPLFAEEAALVVHAVPKRQLEFAIGRTCARRALRLLQVADAPILCGPGREPLWPSGIVGSITHCAGYGAAVAAQALHTLAIGIDAEPHAALPAGLLARVSTPEERGLLARGAANLHWDRLLFSAKESVFKACFPLLRTFLNFEAVLVRFDPGQASFCASLRDGPRSTRVPPVLRGRYLVRNGLLVTAIVVPADDAARRT